ncbi:MAG: S8 family peptidase [Saprospiraceae bacterium]
MPTGNPKSHLFIPSPQASKYRGQGRSRKPLLKPRDRATHYQLLKDNLERARQEIDDGKAFRREAGLGVSEDIILEFASAPGFELVFESLENEIKGIRLLNVREDDSDPEQIVTFATVLIPSDQYGYFLRKLEEYNTKQSPKSGNPINQNLVESIDSIQPASLRSLWTDDESLIPKETEVWCELWVRTDPNPAPPIIETYEMLGKLEIETQSNFIVFPQRLVLLIKVNGEQLANLFSSIDTIAELRAARETAEFWTSLIPSEQAEWAIDLANRMVFSPQGRVAICMMDRGLNNGHVMLASVVADSDCMALDPQWGTDDNGGHGTQMAGLTVFGDLEQVLQRMGTVEIRHHVESVKILPPRGENPPNLYGAITNQAASIAEINQPSRRNRVFCMAVTAGKVDGRPSSWSAALDGMTSGYLDDLQRLFIVSAGNVDPSESGYNYPDTNLLSQIEDPAQAWNALTIGAYTEKVFINDPKIRNYTPLAEAGQLSPHSRTSVLWGEKSKWPLKPDVVLEGGNAAKPGAETSPDGLECLTTYYRYSRFGTINATSAATAKAAWLAAQIWASYPQAWPETIRALIVHSAQWTKAMETQFLSGSKAGDYRKLIQICGFGVPNLERALHSFNNSLILIAQEHIMPFREGESSISMNEMHLYALPWPKEALLDLGAQDVKLRMTLSYFIEPSPGERGWKNRYRYASHGLRFEINRPHETKERFIRRINKAIQAEEDEVDAPEADRLNWRIGPNNRNLGSLHSDWLTMSGTELSNMDNIAVYPVGGWWKTLKKEGRWNRQVRYSLVVSIETPATNVDLYTPIQALIRVQVPIEL